MKEILSHKTEIPSFKSKEIRKDYVAVSLDKTKTKNLLSELNMALSWALHKAGVETLDITIREKEDSYDIIVET